MIRPKRLIHISWSIWLEVIARGRNHLFTDIGTISGDPIVVLPNKSNQLQWDRFASLCIPQEKVHHSCYREANKKAWKMRRVCKYEVFASDFDILEKIGQTILVKQSCNIVYVDLLLLLPAMEYLREELMQALI